MIEALAVDETVIFDDEYLYRCALQAKHKIARDSDKCFVTFRDDRGRGVITRIRDVPRKHAY